MEQIALARVAPDSFAGGAGEAEERRPDVPMRKPLIVLVDGSERHCEAFQALLGARYRLKIFGSGEQAWASLQVDGEADAVVASLDLPRMSGFELVARLRKARLPSLRRIPIALIASSIDETLRGRIGREPVDFVAAWDRPLVDLGAWLRERLVAGPEQPPRPTADALRRWAHQHGALDQRMRESLVVFRVRSDGVGVLGEQIARVVRRPEMMLAQAMNCVWLSVDVPITAAPKFALRLALSALAGAAADRAARNRARLAISWAPMLQLADETYDVLQHLADEEPPAGHVQLVTHHWRFALPFDAARLLVR